MSILNGPKNEDFKEKNNFCDLFGHKKVDCRKFKPQLHKKCTRSLLVYFESKLVNVPSDTQWLDTGTIIHTKNSLQELRNYKKPINIDLVVNMSNEVKIKVEHISTFRFILAFKHV